MLGQLKITEEWLENPGGVAKQEVMSRGFLRLMLGIRHRLSTRQNYSLLLPLSYGAFEKYSQIWRPLLRNEATKISLTKTKTFRVSNTGPELNFLDF